VRFNLFRGGSEALENLKRLAQRVDDLTGWHAELYVDAGDIPDLAQTLESLPAASIDHLGLTEEGLPHLLRLAEGAYGSRQQGSAA
jgi:hypothetical protein